ncbi:hypothetical protein SUDANB25_01826 [Streptomyces sp. SudanB25_2051]
MTAERGSGLGTAGTVTSPAPSRPRAERPLDGPELRTDTDRAVAGPDNSCVSRPDTDRRDAAEREERPDEPPDGRPEARPEDAGGIPAPPPGAPDPGPAPVPDRTGPAAPGCPPPAMPVGGDDTAPSGATTGAMPHVPQYSPPPPTSS